MIKLLVTGGTLDKQYNPLTGELVFKESCLDGLLQQARTTVELDIETLMMKDSLEMTQDDRELVAKTCHQVSCNQIIITHGTDTMVATAQTIAASLPANKTVVLLGAMVPYRFKHSDALFNLGCAVSAVQILSPGVYITMNGQVFNYDEVQKNTAMGQFESLG